MANYKSLKSESIGLGSDSSCLEGAVSVHSEFSFFRAYKDEIGPELIPDFMDVAVFVPRTFERDYDNEIFVGEHGAVANAYNLADEEEAKAIKNILDEEKLKHPEYDYEMIKGEFPISVNGGITYGDGSRTEDTPMMSTHILYIKNYEKFLKPKTRIR